MELRPQGLGNLLEAKRLLTGCLHDTLHRSTITIRSTPGPGKRIPGKEEKLRGGRESFSAAHSSWPRPNKGVWSMKLYILPTSPNSRKVLAVIHHLGLKPEIANLDFANGDTARPEFLALNPNGLVPVLVDGAFHLWESNAINQYLVEKAGGSPLFPRDLQVRADITRWQCWEQAHFNKAFGTLIFESVIKPKFGMGEASAGLVEFCLRETGRFAKVLEGHLRGRSTVVGDDITLADYAMVCLEGYRGATQFDWSPFANINRYFDEVRETEAWIKATSPQPAAVERTLVRA
jgi:glutathione S-transferase